MAIRSQIRVRQTAAEDVAQKQGMVASGALRTSVPREDRDHKELGAATGTAGPKKFKRDKDERPTFHALKMQQVLTPLSYGQRDKLKQQIEKLTSFEDLGLMSSVVNAVYTQVLPHLTEYTPTPVQRLAIPALLSKKGEYQKTKAVDEDGKPVSSKSKTFLLAAETGSGKTLAYLLPVINAVKQQEEVDRNEQLEKEAQAVTKKEEREKNTVFQADPSEDDVPDPNPSMGRPRALILLPSSELVLQVTKVVKQLSHTIKYRSQGISSANSPTIIRNRLFNNQGIDILRAVQ